MRPVGRRWFAAAAATLALTASSPVLAQDFLRMRLVSKRFNTWPQVSDAAVAGDFLFLAGAWGTGLRVIDRSDLNHPQQVVWFDRSPMDVT